MDNQRQSYQHQLTIQTDSEGGSKRWIRSTGLQLATELRLIRPGLPVLMMTGYTTSAMSAGVEAAGVRELLSKPISVHSLGVAVHAALAATGADRLLPT